MGIRWHTDEDGRVWGVWYVPPRFTPKRSGVDRRVRAVPGEYAVKRKAERRLRSAPPEWVEGWLCFESEHEKRRLSPPVEAWEFLSGNELQRLLDLATPVAGRQSTPVAADDPSFSGSRPDLTELRE